MSDTDCDESIIMTKPTHSAIEHLGGTSVGSEELVGETSSGVKLMELDTNFNPSYIIPNTKDHTSSTELLLSSNIKPGQNVCFLCKTPHFKIARHFKIHIKEDPDIEKALSLPVGSSQRRMKLEELRN